MRSTTPVRTTARTKKAVAKKAVAKKRTIRPELAALPTEAQEFLSNAVMSHPGGCTSGKLEFIKRLGLPDPDSVAKFELTVTFPVKPAFTAIVTDPGYNYGSKKLSQTSANQITEAFKVAALAALPPGAEVAFEYFTTKGEAIIGIQNRNR